MVGLATRGELRQQAVPANSPDSFAGHRKATAARLLGVTGAPGSPVSEAMLPILPRWDWQRGRE